MNEIVKQKQTARAGHRIRPVFYFALDRVKKAARIGLGLFPLTWMAAAAGALIYYVWYWEVMPHANQILHAVVLLWLFFAAVMLVFTVISAILVWAMTRRANRGVSITGKNQVGGHVESNYRVYRPFYMPFVTVECEMADDGFIRHAQKSLFWEGEWLEPVGRGRISSIRRRMTIGDIFGLTRISFVMGVSADLEIMPGEARFEQYVFKTTSSGEDGYSHPDGDPRGDLVEMRRYQAGDPLRLVLWKVFARSRKLVVRTPEPTITQQSDLFVYFISGSHDEESAAVARSFLSEIGRSGQQDMNLCFAADGANRIAADSAEGMADIIDSATARNRGGEGIMDIAPLIDPAMMSHCFLLVPSKMGRWFDPIVRFIAQYKVRPTFIVSTDSRHENAQEKHSISRLHRLICADPQKENETHGIEALCKKLAQYGDVRIVDISTGSTSEITTEHAA